MAKKTTKPQVEAPVVEEKKTTPSVNVLQMGDLEKMAQNRSQNGLDANHQVDVLTGLKGMLHDNPNAAEDYNMPKDTIRKINGIVVVGFLAALADEVQYGQNPWAAKMRVSQLEEIKTLAPLIGMEIDTKLLPAPDAEGNVQIPKEAIKISAETKKALAEENARAKKVPTNPTEVENEEQLADALTAFLSDAKINRPFDRFIRAINFYRSYLTIQANKSENKDAEIEKIKNTPDAELLQDISTMAKCPIIVQGYGNYLRGTVEDTKSVIHAFCSFRDASKNRTTGKPAIDDASIAGIVKVIVIWSCNEKIKEETDIIKKIEDGIAALKKDEKANAKGIETETKKAAGHKARIAHYRNIIDITLAPTFDIADQFANDYNDKESENYLTAHKHFGIVMNSYYTGAFIDELNLTAAIANVQQRIGIILNLFSEPLSQRIEYDEKNLIEQESTPPAKTEEEESKK